MEGEEPDEAPEASHTAGLTRSSAVVAAGTLASRVTGLVRTMVTAAVLGAAALANGYNLANTTPNLVYDLVLGGILAASVLPVFVDLRNRGDREQEAAVLTVAGVLLVGASVVVAVASPAILDFYTSLTPASERADVTVVGVPLLRLFAPQILFYGLTALFSAQLNARDRFGAAAFAPVANNVVVIGVMLWFGRIVGADLSPERVASDPAELLLLGLGTTAGIVAQTVVLLPALRRAHVPLRWRFAPRAEAVRRITRLSGWTFGYVVNNVVALSVVLALATRTGGVSAYTYAYVFFQLPYGLFALSMMTAAGPRLAARAQVGDLVGFRAVFATGARSIVLTLLPASIGLAVIALPLVAALLQFKNFTPEDAQATAAALAGFSVFMVGFALYLFSLRGFYAFGDTRTPFVANLFQNGTNLVLAFVLVGPWGTTGLAVAFGLSYALAAVATFVVLRRRAGGLDGAGIVAAAWRAGVATAVMAAVVGAIVVAREAATGPPAGLDAWVTTVLAGVVGVAVYGAGLWLSGEPTVRAALRTAGRRLRRR